MNRTGIINKLIQDNGYGSYLEIGLFDLNRNFNHIKCARKTGVDPSFEDVGQRIFGCTSDTFFRLYAEKYDLIFIDGLHTYEQSYIDVINALDHLTDNGCIVLHDCLPNSEQETGEDKPAGGVAWCGDVYKTMFDAAKVMDSELFECDHGVGVVRPKGYRGALPSNDVSFDDYMKAIEVGI